MLYWEVPPAEGGETAVPVSEGPKPGAGNSTGMEFHEAANFLFDLRRFAPRPGLDPTRDLLAELGDPHENLVCVQVAGSNGKGSTARMVERSLRERVRLDLEGAGVDPEIEGREV